ncbi:hypothetical protein [Photobacterium damselae]|uniref:hypothetical protein n=1 Tax=Photobacterium damselae TaxID=38293 RepID=UPI00107670BA|nr:hypothetical protein [Photobacterium damselae]MBE8127751.1 hypothetical protein [Photobacterium damselae subsp. piscicida]TLS88318.1 hypothetical protein FD720_05670 [Photobacterium damselae subsp. damselae]WIH22013.1 hypothetical protein KQY33_20275 [Photobacterium damselae]
MCKLSSYSKYQKRVIKFLNDLLGTETPFSYERTQLNHLKVLIDGVPKPIFTGSTPSDCKSINNFMAEVKRELRANKLEPEQTEQKEKPRLPFQVSNDKLIQGCVKSLRTRVETLKSQEEALVLEHKNVEEINKARMETVKHAVSLALQSRKSGAYLKRKEMKEIEDTVMRHLNFMLPTAACYADLLDTKNKYQPKSGTSLPVETLRGSDETEESSSNNVVKIDEKVQPMNTETNKKQTEVNFVQEKSNNDSASELMAMSANNRVSLLRNLPKAQALSLIDDINQALALNREQDIEAVVNLMRDKDLPLEAIISRLEAA